jgi:hypothetical protein
MKSAIAKLYPNGHGLPDFYARTQRQVVSGENIRWFRVMTRGPS